MPASRPGAEPRVDVAVVKAVTVPVQPRRLRKVVTAVAAVPEVAARLPAPDAAVRCGVAVRVTGDTELRRLNRDFLGEDSVTDVLSFPGLTSGPGTTPIEECYLGDIAVSWPACQRQAAEYGHTAELELAFLVIHGFLHLLGWDHGSPAEAAEMERLSGAALEAAGLPQVGLRL